MTKKQREIYNLLRKKSEEGCLVPSYQEIADELGLKSKSQVARMMTSLEEQGLIVRTPRKARSIEVICKPTDYKRGYASGYRDGVESARG